MDGPRFDTLARFLTETRSRRGALATLLGGTIGLLGLTDTAAKKGKGKKKGKKGKKGKNGGGNGGGGGTPGAGDDGGSASLDAEEQAFLTLLNNHRAANGLQPLAHNEKLGAAAEYHSQDMGANNYFDHVSPAGVDARQNIKNHGYDPDFSGENISAGREFAGETFEGWKNSPAHNANMLSPDFTETGIGRAYAASSQYGWYWTNTFGSPN